MGVECGKITNVTFRHEGVLKIFFLEILIIIFLLVTIEEKNVETSILENKIAFRFWDFVFQKVRSSFRFSDFEIFFNIFEIFQISDVQNFLKMFKIFSDFQIFQNKLRFSDFIFVWKFPDFSFQNFEIFQIFQSFRNFGFFSQTN